MFPLHKYETISGVKNRYSIDSAVWLIHVFFFKCCKSQKYLWKTKKIVWRSFLTQFCGTLIKVILHIQAKLSDGIQHVAHAIRC